MEAGREFDAAVATLLGHRVEWRWCDHTLGYSDWHEVESSRHFRMHEDLERHPCIVCEGGGQTLYSVVPFYSTDMDAAWIDLCRPAIRAGGSAWIQGDGHTGYSAGMTLPRRAEAHGDTEAHAICLAFLLAATHKAHVPMELTP